MKSAAPSTKTAASMAEAIRAQRQRRLLMMYCPRGAIFIELSDRGTPIASMKTARATTLSAVLIQKAPASLEIQAAVRRQIQRVSKTCFI